MRLLGELKGGVYIQDDCAHIDPGVIRRYYGTDEYDPDMEVDGSLTDPEGMGMSICCYTQVKHAHNR